ncbi:MAG: TATA-box-binding protein [Desulfurococcaceae archaeon]|uniref:TATA-box-binding protein n=1 Tax=Staphylothermus marinus TaxID=2280 RepID=A0A7C4JMH5_STAMA
MSSPGFKPKPSHRIENIVATVILEQPLNTELIMDKLRDLIYQPDKFPGLVFRIEKPKATALIFRSGKMVVTGTKSMNMLIEVVKKIVKYLNRAGIDIVSKPRTQVQNIVASGDIGARVNLEEAAYTLEDCIYEPEQFPGLIHKMRDPHVVLLIFSSGKMVLTGAKEEIEVAIAVEKIANRLYEAGCLLGV